MVLVQKKDRSLHFCIDLCKLNMRMVKDAYSLPHIEKTLDCLNGAKTFTSLDLKLGYCQVKLDEESKKLNAFMVDHISFCECEQMLIGLMNALETFQWPMETCLWDLHLNWCIIYLDDIISFSNTLKEYIKWLRGVFQKLATTRLKLRPSKSKFFHKQRTYLGHIVTHEGIETDPKKVSAIKNWPQPETVTQVWSFLGFTNHYCRFIHKYAQIAWPINQLISGKNTSKKKSTMAWNNECQIVLEIETTMQWYPSASICWSYEGLSSSHRCQQTWMRGGSLPETGRRPWSGSTFCKSDAKQTRVMVQCP